MGQRMLCLYNILEDLEMDKFNFDFLTSWPEKEVK